MTHSLEYLASTPNITHIPELFGDKLSDIRFLSRIPYSTAQPQGLW